MTKSKYSKMVGKAGEDNLLELLETIPGKKRIIRNLYMPTNNGTTEIDGIMIHETGIYIFECKNYSGRVTGNIDDANWICRYDNGSKYTMYNPTKQNSLHSNVVYKYLRDYVGYVKTYSYVVFNNGCKLDVEGISKYHRVVTLNDVSTLLYLDSQYSTAKYSWEQIDRIYDLLEKFTGADKRTVKKHSAQVRKRYGINNQVKRSRKHCFRNVAAVLIIVSMLASTNIIPWLRDVRSQISYVRTSLVYKGEVLLSVTTPKVESIVDILENKLPCSR